MARRKHKARRNANHPATAWNEDLIDPQLWMLARGGDVPSMYELQRRMVGDVPGSYYYTGKKNPKRGQVDVHGRIKAKDIHGVIIPWLLSDPYLVGMTEERALRLFRSMKRYPMEPGAEHSCRWWKPSPGQREDICQMALKAWRDGQARKNPSPSHQYNVEAVMGEDGAEWAQWDQSRAGVMHRNPREQRYIVSGTNREGTKLGVIVDASSPQEAEWKARQLFPPMGHLAAEIAEEEPFAGWVPNIVSYMPYRPASYGRNNGLLGDLAGGGRRLRAKDLVHYPRGRAAPPEAYKHFLKPSTKSWPIWRADTGFAHAKVALQYMTRGFGNSSEYPQLIERMAQIIPPSDPQWGEIWEKYQRNRAKIAKKAGRVMPDYANYVRRNPVTATTLFVVSQLLPLVVALAKKMGQKKWTKLKGMTIPQRAQELDKMIGRAAAVGGVMGPAGIAPMIVWKRLGKMLGKEKLLITMAQMIDDPQVQETVQQTGQLALEAGQAAAEAKMAGGSASGAAKKVAMKKIPLPKAANNRGRRRRRRR
jgi:hypothetical protein